MLTNVQGAAGGSYLVTAVSPYGSALSSNAVLAVDLFPIIVTQPQTQAVPRGSNFAVSVIATTSASCLSSS